MGTGDSHALNEPGGLAWNEIWTADAAATIAFYRGVIGWNPKEQGGYTMFAGSVHEHEPVSAAEAAGATG